MKSPVTFLALALALAAPAWAQTTRLLPEQARISDEAIRADQRAYEALQARIQALNERGRPLRDYHLSKAQCWLDASLHEYTRNDRGAFPQAAMTESETLIVAMEKGVTPLPNQTPLVGQAVRLRGDLWSQAEGLKSHAGYACAQQKVACAEVELVHAGNEQVQQQWRHAKPYVQIAEDLLGEARKLADACLPPPAPPAPAVARPATATVLVPVQELTLSLPVVFSFNKHGVRDVRRYSAKQLQEMLARIRSEGLAVQSVRLSGHADRLNRTGQAAYNLQLSEKRVLTVRELVMQAGVDPTLISSGAFGDSQQVELCRARYRSAVELHECLLPNRRVDVVIVTRKP